MNVVALTPTGYRPEGLALLGEYLNSQTYRGDLTWIVVDDCDPATRIPAVRDGIGVWKIRPEWRWKPGYNTQAKCLHAGLEEVPNDSALVILEDDDVYMPEHIETMLGGLKKFELVGEKDSRYYNVATCKYRVLAGSFHSSLASTAMRGSALQMFKELCGSGRKTMLDVTLWKTFAGTKKLIPTENVVGIKGLPGRPGIGVGHRRNFGTTDNGAMLDRWAGEYARNYDIFREAA